ncbi:uncharacterized protein BDV14DRAFT_140116 [Aspergillus stella-maris]|uniref:uncharacterized protein n=1 Tax=Aspergillus stella-maris TaxID=1810926 RepID=UPI003CCD012B
MSDIDELFENDSVSPALKSEDAVQSEPSQSAETKKPLPLALKPRKFPPTSKRLYFPIIPGAGGQNCLPLVSLGLSSVSFFKTLPRDALRVSVNQVVQTSHDNIVNIQEMYLSPHSITLTYECWGISLLELCRVAKIFANDEPAVATICKEVLHGLRYIHEEIGIVHGSISCGTVILTDTGRVKIADVGDSMIAGRCSDRVQDYQAVCQMCASLLDLGSASTPQGSLRLAAEEFAKAAAETSLDGLLNHPFLRGAMATCTLQPFPILLKILQQFR